MERQRQRDLEILTAIAEGRPLTQRALAQRLRVALGLTNLILRRLAKKGYIKIVEFPRKEAAGDRLRYLLTPKGIAEKTRLAYDHTAYAVEIYRRARQTLRESLSLLPRNGLKRIALYGTGEPAELAYLTLKEFGLEPVGVFARQAGGSFLGFSVRAVTDLAAEEFDALVLATFERPEQEVAELVALGLPQAKVLTLRRPHTSPAPSLA
ncbi:MAG: winged helix-turn-helix transcriptional regulator [Candidatus Rokuibacteriota bacterium]